LKLDGNLHKILHHTNTGKPDKSDVALIFSLTGSQFENLCYLCSVYTMKRIVAKRTLKEFWEKHPDSEQYLKTWYEIAKHADWGTPNEVKETFASASIISNSRVVFNIKGNTYRLIVKFNYHKQWMFIRFIGTHAEYDKIDATTV